MIKDVEVLYALRREIQLVKAVRDPVAAKEVAALRLARVAEQAGEMPLPRTRDLDEHVNDPGTVARGRAMLDRH